MKLFHQNIVIKGYFLVWFVRVVVITGGTNEKSVQLNAVGLCAYCLNRSVVALRDKEIWHIPLPLPAI